MARWLGRTGEVGDAGIFGGPDDDLFFRNGTTGVVELLGQRIKASSHQTVLPSRAVERIVLQPGNDTTITLGLPTQPVLDPQYPVLLTPVLNPTTNIQLGASAAISVALVGQAATGSVGVFNFGVTQALTGQAATATGGTLVPSIDTAFTGQAATGTGGVLTPNIAVVLTGQAATATGGVFTFSLLGLAATATGGILTPNIAVTLTGQAATGTGGILVPTLILSLVGQASTASGGVLTPNLFLNLTGLAATSAQGTLSPSGASSVALTGLTITATQGQLWPSLQLSGLQVTASIGSVGTFIGSGVTQALTGIRLIAGVGYLTTPQPTLDAVTDVYFLSPLPDLVTTQDVSDLFALTLPDLMTYTAGPDQNVVRTNEPELVV